MVYITIFGIIIIKKRAHFLSENKINSPLFIFLKRGFLIKYRYV